LLKALITYLILFVSTISVSFSQTEKLSEKLPDELNQEQWEYVRDLYAVDAIKLLAKLDTLNLEIDSLKLLNQYAEDFDCEKELYAVVGATKEQVADYRRKFDEAEGYLKSRGNSPDDAAKNYFQNISASKIKCLPEFSDRFYSMKKIIDSYSNVTQFAEVKDNYNVVKGDCLWKISMKKYRTPYLWPAIWETNKTEIDDPNFLYPGQVLKIPLMNEEDRKKALERSKEFRKSRILYNNLQN